MTESLASAVAALQADLPRIEKSERADVQTKQGSYSYTYAGLASITAQIMPLLSKHGLSFIAKPTFSGDRFVLGYSLLHSSGEREDGEYPLPTTGTPQAIGSAITYGRRYCLCSITGVAPEEDDDGATAEAEAQTKRGTAQRSTRPQRQPQQQEPAKKTAQRGTKKAEAPPLPGENADGMSAEQRSKLMATFADMGVDDRAERLRISSEIVGRELSSANDMTRDEVRKLIDELGRRREQPFGDEGGEQS